METKIPQGCTLKEINGALPEEHESEVSILRFSTWKDRTSTIKPSTPDWRESMDDWGWHFLIHQGNRLVGAARLHVYDEWSSSKSAEYFDGLNVSPKNPVGYLSRLVVDPNSQGLGIGTFLDKHRVLKAQELGAKSVICDVPSYRVPHMVKLGFKVCQSPKMGLALPDIEWTGLYLEF